MLMCWEGDMPLIPQGEDIDGNNSDSNSKMCFSALSSSATPAVFNVSAQSCLTLCDPMDSSDHGILQARILEWEAIPFSRVSSRPKDQIWVSRIARRFLLSEPPGKPHTSCVLQFNSILTLSKNNIRFHRLRTQSHKTSLHF